MGISGKFKRLLFICVKPRQRNSGVYRCQILRRIRFHRSPRRKLPQFKGLHGFDEVDRVIFDPIFWRKNHGSRRWRKRNIEADLEEPKDGRVDILRNRDQNIFVPKVPSGYRVWILYISESRWGVGAKEMEELVCRNKNAGRSKNSANPISNETVN